MVNIYNVSWKQFKDRFDLLVQHARVNTSVHNKMLSYRRETALRGAL